MYIYMYHKCNYLCVKQYDTLTSYYHVNTTCLKTSCILKGERIKGERRRERDPKRRWRIRGNEMEIQCSEEK